MNNKHLFWIIPTTFLISLFIFGFGIKDSYDLKDFKMRGEMSNYWACMDGCSNMQEILEGKPLYNNETAKFKHDVCSGVCCRQYMTILGCS